MDDDIDRDLTKLGLAVERVGANLVGLERDEHRQLIDAATLAGETQTRWLAVRAAVSDLFDGYANLLSLVERAVALRAADKQVSVHSAAELEHLLHDPVIERSRHNVSLHDRGLLDASTKIVFVSADELVADMSRAFGLVTTTTNEVMRGWNELMPRVAELRNRVANSSQRSVEVGDDWDLDIARTREEVEAIGARLVCDPLAVDSAGITHLEDAVRSIDREINDVASLKTGLAQRLTSAEETARDVAEAEQLARDAMATLTSRIASPSVPTYEAVSTELVARLRAITAIAREGSWRTAAQDLDEWTRDATTALSRIRAAAAHASLPVRRRDELRGRLEAYNAKAARLGLSESAEANRIYDSALRALYDAPTDLERAEEWVRRYQRAITAPSIEGKART